MRARDFLNGNWITFSATFWRSFTKSWTNFDSVAEEVVALGDAGGDCGDSLDNFVFFLAGAIFEFRKWSKIFTLSKQLYCYSKPKVYVLIRLLMICREMSSSTPIRLLTFRCDRRGFPPMHKLKTKTTDTLVTPSEYSDCNIEQLKVSKHRKSGISCIRILRSKQFNASLVFRTLLRKFRR